MEDPEGHETDSMDELENLRTLSIRIRRAYIIGQFSNVWKTATWWSMFGVLLVSLTGDLKSIGFSRAAFNLALILSSPMAGAFAEYVSIRKILTLSSLNRLLLWGVFIPGGWFFIKHVLRWNSIFYVYILILMFFDGIQVAFEMVVAMDSGGLEILNDQLNLIDSEQSRNFLSHFHQSIFDITFIVITPQIALLFWALAPSIPHGQDPFLNILFLVMGLAIYFTLFSFVSLIFYLKGLPKQKITNTPPLLAEEEFTVGLLRMKTRARWMDIKDGFFIVLHERALLYRLVFLALETALEDTMVSIIIPMIALHGMNILEIFPDSTTANLFASCLSAIGKVGSVISSALMSFYWKPPENHSWNAFRYLFWFILMSSVCVFALPISSYLLEMGTLSVWIPPLITCIGIFLFFAFSTAPKIGFSVLLQSLVTSPQIAGKVYSFVGIFVMLIDALLLLIVNIIFAYLGKTQLFLPLLIVAILFFIHGTAELFFGTTRILRNHGTTPSDPEEYPTAFMVPPE